MKIDKFLQKYFKKIFQFLFILFYGKIKENDELVIRDLDKKKITDINLKDNIKYRVNKYIYEIPDARVYTDTVQHVAIIKDNTILPNISSTPVSSDSYIVSGKTITATKVDGSTDSIIYSINGSKLTLTSSSSSSSVVVIYSKL